MANQTLIKGELGVHMQPTFKGELIAKPMAAAMNNFIKQDSIRSKQNAAKAGKIEEKALRLQSKGSFGGVPKNVATSGQSVINNNIDDGYRKTGSNEDHAKADSLIEDINFDNNAFLDSNAKFVKTFGNLDGEIDLEDKSNISVGSSELSFQQALAIYGGDDNVTVEYDTKEREYRFYNEDGSTTMQGNIGSNVFEKNASLGTMITNEATKQGGKDMTGVNRYLDYNKHLKTKGQIVSGYFDEMYPGVPSVDEHLGDKDWSNVDHKDFDQKRLKEETIRYYNNALASEQTNYQTVNASKIAAKNKTNSGNTKQAASNTFMKNLTDNIASGDATTNWGDHTVKRVEWRKDPDYPNRPELTKLFEVGGAQIPGYNYKSFPIDKPLLYTGDKAGNVFKFFDPNNPADLSFIKNKLMIAN